jgi:hypothetical protein
MELSEGALPGVAARIKNLIFHFKKWQPSLGLAIPNPWMAPYLDCYYSGAVKDCWGNIYIKGQVYVGQVPAQVEDKHQ